MTYVSVRKGMSQEILRYANVEHYSRERVIKPENKNSKYQICQRQNRDVRWHVQNGSMLAHVERLSI